jgi:hypothetical protein
MAAVQGGMEKTLYPLVLLVFAGVTISTFYFVFTNVGNNDNKKDVKNAMYTIGGLNLGATVALLFLGTWFTRTNPEARSSYSFLMAHLNFFLAIMAVSISVIVQYST